MNSIPVRDAIHFLEFARQRQPLGGRYMAIPIFKFAFPGYEVLFTFENVFNHRAFTPDTLLASRTTGPAASGTLEPSVVGNDIS